MAPSSDTAKTPAPAPMNRARNMATHTNGNSAERPPSQPVQAAKAVAFHDPFNGSGATTSHANGIPTPVPSPLPELFIEKGSHRIQSFGVHENDSAGPSRIHARIRSWGDDAKGTNAFPRISKPTELMRSSYDCVVIGSGYGGGVAASRMARAGESVCLLERGKERWPGEYPSDMGDALDQVHYSGEFAPGWLPKKIVNGGDPTGMYHIIFGNGQNAIVANGLGGTSLMNANVYLRADKATLSMEMWPEEIRNDPSSLDQYFEKVEEVLEPKQYPKEWPDLPKLDLLEKQANHLNMGKKFRRVHQTTRFHNGPNSCGVEMAPSALTGQDATGLNDGSKNTTLVTYLADAWNWGAEMFCESEVRYITKAPDREGYIVYFAWHGRNRGHFKANLHGDLMWVHAKKAVFLGAGAIGTTEILLRSKEMGLDMSEQVGQNMSGNGDMLAFGYNTNHEVNAVGSPFPSPYHPVGPCITGIIDNREGHENPLDGYVIEEGTVPKALAPFLQAMLELLPGSVAPQGESLIEQFRANLARAGSLFLGPYFRQGAIERSQVFLVMSHDSNQAILTLKEDKPVLEFLGVGRSDHVKYLNDILGKATRAVGGTFVQNPFYSLMKEQQITVHPIGGACMSSDGTGKSGATNHFGEVFAGEGRETHRGLIVTDGAVIPAALGANPLATITALAERSLDVYAKRERLRISTRKNGILDLFGSPQYSHHSRRWFDDEDDREESMSISSAKTVINTAERLKDGGFGFTEVMSGFIHRDEGLKRDCRQTYELAARMAESRCESARFFLSVQSFNTRSVVNDPEHRAMLTGTFSCPTIPGSPFMVQRGDFNLFRQDLKAPGTRNLIYNFHMRGVDGRLLRFRGYKVVDSSVALSPMQFWRATSTLYVTITEPYVDNEYDEDEAEDDLGARGKIIAKGIMKIQPADFASQMLTVTPTGSSLLKKVVSATSFLTYFTRKSMSLFLAPLTPLQYPTQSYKGYVNDTPPSATWTIEAEDGCISKMHMWEPTHIVDGEAKNLFMVPGAAVDHQIYALPTIRYNAVNYFTRAGYRVFITVHRIGMVMAAQKDWTTFDARLDIKACLETIRKEYDTKPIYTIAHCMGSVALSTGLLDGTIPTDWISGVTCSQVFMNPMWNTMNLIKAMAAPVPLDRAYKAVAGSWFSCSTGPDDSFVQKAFNEMLRFMPDERKELCNNASCHRTALVFGRCWNHHNLNEATHRQIDRFFGGVNMTLLHLLMKQGVEGGVMSNTPLCERLDTRENILRLRGIPFLLFVGRDNAVLSPASTEKTYEKLCDAFGTRDLHDGEGLQYKRRVVPDYGHLDCWMGRNAWKDVYPFVREEVDRVVRGEKYVFKEPRDRFLDMVENGLLNY
ncbi:glucose-methanol-choline oxidoreductase [Pseudomassariella vexata]|uniref:Cholesterol oxidase n=1 Tax=Pseudomassariella vexata TaxID=1141098 RepID=A0A1Y2EJM1_9PEZI|nr:glucose-methanol-choline oxidoreductase [Pseudomassariella vexata]ORY71697.1 glucose-methanol-choline oxidoreductase [Pseudomassariella vexata]